MVRATRSSRSVPRADSRLASASSAIRALGRPVEAADRPELASRDAGVEAPPFGAAWRSRAAAMRAATGGDCPPAARAPRAGPRRDTRHRDPQVDPVAQRAGHARRVAVGDAGACSGSAVGSLPAMPARARVHRRDELEAGRERSSARPDPDDRDAALLERLAERLEHVPVELRQLVEEQDAVVGQGHFAGRQARAAADHARVGDRVVRRPERRPADEAGHRSLRRDRVDDRGAPAPRRRAAAAAARDRSAPAASCPTPGGPISSSAVAAGQRDLERPSRLDLAAHVGEVRHVRLAGASASPARRDRLGRSAAASVDARRRPSAARRRVRRRAQDPRPPRPASRRRIDSIAVTSRASASAVGRHDDPPHAAPGEGRDHRQQPGHAAAPRRRATARRRAPSGRAGPHLLRAEQDRDRDRRGRARRPPCAGRPARG